MSAGCFELVALLFVPAWLPRRLACWRWWQGAWLHLHCDVAHMFLAGTQEWCIPSWGSVQPVGPGWAQLEAQEVPKGSTNRSLTRRESISCAAFWALFRSWLLWLCTPSISPAALWWGEMAIRPFNIIINLVDSSSHPQLPYGCSFDLVLKEPGATFCPLSSFWTSLPLLQIKNNSGRKLVYNKKCNHCVYPTYEPPEWKLWVWLWLSLRWFHSNVTLMTSTELLLIDTLTSNQKRSWGLLHGAFLPQTETKGIYFQTSAA